MSDPYVYENTSVVKNILGIKEQDKLDEYENTVVNLSLLKLFNEDYKVKHTLDIFDLHKKLFYEVYEWAGQSRSINIEKLEQVLAGLSVQYEDVSNIKKALEITHNQYFYKPSESFSFTSNI